MNIKKILIFSGLLLTVTGVFSQNVTQTVKGRVFEEGTDITLPGANIVIPGTNPLIGTNSDTDGNFRIDAVPVGRYSIKISFLGYEPLVLNEILVSSGKEFVITAGLKPLVTQINEVVVRAVTGKDKPLNTMATVSARAFSVEEASRYAGGLDDPARLASSFAGVASNMSSNGIVVRGNAPKGILWELEGVEIANPSHFANITAFGGGGITALSSQMLANSDFYTGAFPAQYGNALSGVFDLKLRTGNDEKYEHTFQIGALGTDISSEGPLCKGKSYSYLFNYRVSTLALISPLLPENAKGINYHDLSFMLNFPAGASGTFSLWGLMGYDNMVQEAVEDTVKWQYDHDKERHNSRLFLGSLGVNHKFNPGKNTSVSTSVAVSGNSISWKVDDIDNSMQYLTSQDIYNIEGRYIFTSTVNHKFSVRHSNRSGVTISNLNYNLKISDALQTGSSPVVLTDEKGNSNLLVAFTQSRFNITERIMLNIGLHAQYFALNNKASLEPRVAVKWSFTPLQGISLGYGNHSQIEPLYLYFISREKGNSMTYPDKNMDFSKAHHFVAGYDLMISEHMRLKIEPYVQILYDIPVIPDSSFSLINLETGWFINDSLVNSGTGKNIGIDFTVERFFNKGYYFLFTASLFDSHYKGGDGVERDTRYNRHYVINILAGKEWYLGENGKNILEVNARVNALGGERISPVDVNASLSLHEIIYDENRAFENKKKDAVLLSIGASLKRNKPSYTGTWAFQITNLLNAKESFGYRYNFIKNTIDTYEQVIIIPNISYRIDF